MRKTLFLICLLALLPLSLNSQAPKPRRASEVKIITQFHKLHEIELEWALAVSFRSGWADARLCMGLSHPIVEPTYERNTCETLETG